MEESGWNATFSFATTVAFLLLCCVGIAVGVKVLVSPPAPPQSTVLQAGRTAPSPRPTYQPGEKIQIGDVDFSAAERTLLLVVQKGCRYCDESMPFYRRLKPKQTVPLGTRIVVVAPDDMPTTQAELARHGVEVDQIVQAMLSQLKVRGTPTAIVVNRTGAIERVMPGKLDEVRERELIRALSVARASDSQREE